MFQTCIPPVFFLSGSIRNPGGSFLLLTKCSGEKRCVEIVDAETGAGANVQQWVPTGSTCQWWTFETVG